VTENNLKGNIIFYTRTGKTRAVAEAIKEVYAYDLQEIIDLRDRSGLLGYISGVIDILLRPITKISPKEINLDHYNLIYIGAPIWGNRFPPAITTFFSTARFLDKKVVLFADFGSSMKDSLFVKYGKLISDRGGEVIGTFKVKTRGKSIDAIKDEAKKILMKNAGRWNLHEKGDAFSIMGILKRTY
jgi:flavodoxin